MRYRFGRFVLSPARRVLCQDGREIALIPRYFDLLHLLMLVDEAEMAIKASRYLTHVLRLRDPEEPVHARASYRA